MAYEPIGRTAPVPQWLDPSEQHAWRSYLDGHQRLMAELNHQLQHDSALTLTEYRILVLLSEAPGAALRMSDLAAALVSSRSRLTHQIRRMEQTRLVRRTACEDDGRGVFAHLTQDGARCLRAAAPGHVAAVRRAFVDLLSPGQLETIGAVFDRVSAELSRRHELESS